MFSKYPLVIQEDWRDCGPACVATLIKYYNGNIPLYQLRQMCLTTNKGTTALNMIRCLKKLGFNAQGFKIPFSSLKDAPIIYPCIAHVILEKYYHHFIIIYKIDFQKQQLIIGDPQDKIKKYSFNYFKKVWDNIFINAIPHQKLPVIKEPSINIFYYLITNLKDYKRLIGLVFLITFIYIIAVVILSFNLQYIINGINTSKPINYFIIGLIFFSIISFIKISTDYLKNRIMINLNSQIDQQITNDIFKKTIYLPYHYYQNRTTGEIFTKINDLNAIKTLISNLILLLCLDLPLLILSLIILWHLNATMTLTSIIIVLLYWWLIIIFKNNNNNNIKNYQIQKSIINTNQFQTLKAFNTIKGLDIENNINNQFKEKYQEYIDAKLKLEHYYNLQYLSKELIYSLGILMILTLGSIMVIADKISLGKLMTFSTLTSTFLFSLRNFIDLDTNYKEAKSALNRIKSLFIEVKTEENNHVITKGEIKIKNLNFSFNDKEILKNFSCKIKPGSKVMMIGKSGSGKSTLCHLLMKYHSVEDNQIFIDRIDINKYTNINKYITYVNQNEILFTDTLYNNLTLNRSIDNNELTTIVKMCEIDKIITDDLGLNIKIEETGFGLSGGQIQQIALARALFNHFSILIIDEGLNQMDVDLERRILKRLIAKYQNKTIIVISHRNDNQDLFNQIINLKHFNK